MSRHGSTYYRTMLAALDELGVNITINRIGPRWYEVHRNFQAVKKYRTRRSANKYVVREYNRYAVTEPP